MIANYHTHTPRCGHAQGSEQEYVDAALSSGLKLLGFSDHTPYPFPDGYRSTFRMLPEELPDYVATVNGLKEKYAGQLEIHLGVEAEYYPKYFDGLLELLRQNQVEYMILGQHFVGNEPEGVYSGRETLDPKILEHYVRQSIAAMDTGLFTYMAHPDLLNFGGSQKDYDQWMTTLIREARDHELPLEFNFLGYREHRNYPDKRFLALVAQEGIPMVFGCDAHHPSALSFAQTESEVRALLASYGIPVLDTVPLRSIG